MVYPGISLLFILVSKTSGRVSRREEGLIAIAKKSEANMGTRSNGKDLSESQMQAAFHSDNSKASLSLLWTGILS